ncbi:hypothetical protein [Occallatibacter savannae]|uniref:hypothetical protein n=1 Tax=Occallatibacter savannae TaxID=1002691 RepID=UPI000D69180B|nr:hypothetical protein [Occallatibacter savannae]
MGRTHVDETYLSAFHAAVEQREYIFREFELLKQRRTLLEQAARSLEPLVYPDEYHEKQAELAAAAEQAVKAVVEIRSSAPSPEIWNPTIPAEVPAPVVAPAPVPEAAPVQAVTQVYVHGDGEPDDEIQRRISIAIGRSAAD